MGLSELSVIFVDSVLLERLSAVARPGPPRGPALPFVLSTVCSMHERVVGRRFFISDCADLPTCLPCAQVIARFCCSGIMVPNTIAILSTVTKPPKKCFFNPLNGQRYDFVPLVICQS